MRHSHAIQAYWDAACRLLESHQYHATVARAADLLTGTYRTGGTVVTLGDAGSASTASHFAADLAKYATNDRADFRVACLSDSAAALAAWTDESSWAAYCERSVATWLGDGGGVFCAFSIRGGSRNSVACRSRHVVRAAMAAKAMGNKVIAFTGFDGGRLGPLADVHVNVPVAEEPIATPLTESLHLAAHQAICLALRTSAEDPTPTPMVGRPVWLAA
jgi:D-sedoheptulose 7-phosphate isomerase